MSIQSYIAENKLEWQILFNGPTDAFSYTYRGSLVITPGKVISEDRVLPPKEVIKQAILASSGEMIDFLACELETIDLFENFFARYSPYLNANRKYILFVCDLNEKGKFVYEGITFYAYPLDESSVWNELIDFADLSKGDLKKLSDKEKLDEVIKEVSKTNLRISDKSYAEVKTAKSGGKVFFGAV